MIARVWRGEVPAELAEEYESYLEGTGVADSRATPGNLGVEVLRRRVRDERVEFLFVSYWESLDVIRAFAGDDVERARYYPEDRRFLVALAPTVDHYERVLTSGAAGS